MYVCVCLCKGAPSFAEVHHSTPLFPLLALFFFSPTFTNETICMAEEDEEEEEEDSSVCEKEKERKKKT